MEDGSPIWGMIIILILVMIIAFVILLRTTLENVSVNSLKKKAESGEERATHLLKILDNQSRYVMALDFLLVLCSILIGVIFSKYYIPGIERVISESNLKLDIRYLRPVYYILSIGLLVLFTAIIGYILPKKLAAKYVIALSYQIWGIMYVLGKALSPLAWLLDKTLYLVLRILGIKPSTLEEIVTEDELLAIINEGHEQGVFDAGEAEMLSNIIELDEKEAQDIMTPKKKIIAVNSDMTVEAALNYMLSENYSRYPLYEENRDNIIGILHLKDVTSAYISKEQRKKQLKELAREPYFVPDTQNIKILFHEMQSKNIHMAIVIDEYGQTAGLVAMEDFIEEIVGNIQDEYDKEETMVISVESDAYVVRGSISLENLEKALDIDLENDDYDTLNGLLISIMGRIPLDGETEILEYEKYRFEILDTKNRMIELVRITKIPEMVLVEADTEA